MPPSLELQNGNKVGCVDEGFVFGAFIVAEHTVVSPFGEQIDSNLDRGIDTEFSDPPG
jgi:hypothetical protein